MDRNKYHQACLSNQGLPSLLQANIEESTYHTSRLVSTAALDVMTTQRDVIYTAKAETRVKLHKLDKAALGLTVARLVEDGGAPTKVGLPSGICVSCRTLVGRVLCLPGSHALLDLQLYTAL